MKNYISTLILLLLVVHIGILTYGCSVPTANFGSTLEYFYPDWTPDGHIICIKKISEWEESGAGGGSFRRITSEKYFISTMSEDGTQEATIKQIDKL